MPLPMTRVAKSGEKQFGVRRTIQHKGAARPNVRSALVHIAQKVGFMCAEPEPAQSPLTLPMCGHAQPMVVYSTMNCSPQTPRMPESLWSDELDEDADWHFKVLYPRLLSLERCFLSVPLALPVRQIEARALLVDWLVRRHQDYDLTELTLFLAVRVLDQSLTKHWVREEDMRRLGATALIMAAKFEDEVYPEYDGLAINSGGDFTVAELPETELKMLEQIDYRLHTPTVGHHLRWFVKLCNAGSRRAADEQEQLTLATYLAELGLYCSDHASWIPTQYAAAAVFLSNVLMSLPSWPRPFEMIVICGEESVREGARSVAADIFRVLGNSSPGQAIYDKHEELSGVASQAIRLADRSMGPNWRASETRPSPCHIS